MKGDLGSFGVEFLAIDGTWLEGVGESCLPIKRMACSSCALLSNKRRLQRSRGKNDGFSSVMAFSSLQQLHRNAETGAESGTFNIA